MSTKLPPVDVMRAEIEKRIEDLLLSDAKKYLERGLASITLDLQDLQKKQKPGDLATPDIDLAYQIIYMMKDLLAINARNTANQAQRLRFLKKDGFFDPDKK